MDAGRGTNRVCTPKNWQKSPSQGQDSCPHRWQDQSIEGLALPIGTPIAKYRGISCIWRSLGKCNLTISTCYREVWVSDETAFARLHQLGRFLLGGAAHLSSSGWCQRLPRGVAPVSIE